MSPTATSPTSKSRKSLAALRRLSRSGRRADGRIPLVIDAKSGIRLRKSRRATFIDLRNWEVLDQTGWILDSLHCPPGEFATLLDPASPLHARLFEPGGVFVFYGGPKTGPLSAARKARALGLEATALRGGLRAWRLAGGRVGGHPDSALPILKTSIGVAYRHTLRGIGRRFSWLFGKHGPAGAG